MPEHPLADTSSTEHAPAVWPPPPTALSPPPPAGAALSKVETWPADLLVYSFVWLLTASFVLNVAIGIHLNYGVVWHEIAAGYLFTKYPGLPLDILWLVCASGFGLLHRGYLERLEKRRPFADGPGRLRLQSLAVTVGVGLVQLVIVSLAATGLHFFAADAWQPSNLANRIHAINRALLIYGMSAGLASIAAGWALGVLWARRAARVP